MVKTAIRVSVSVSRGKRLDGKKSGAGAPPRNHPHPALPLEGRVRVRGNL